MKSVLASLADGEPSISTTQASLLTLFYTLLYVGILYISRLSRPNKFLSSDAPSVIAVRVRLAIISTVTCLAITSGVIYGSLPPSKGDWRHVMEALGISIDLWSFWRIWIVLKTVGSLYFGSIVEYYLLNEGWREFGADGRYIFKTWTGWKKYLVGPLTEELVFRACIIPLHLMAGRSLKWVTFATPLYFGIAHLHHLYEWRLHNHSAPILKGILISTIQFVITTLFGWFAAFTFMKSESLWAVFLSHFICNWFGLPRVVGTVDGKLWKTMAYYPCLALGLVNFYHELQNLVGSKPFGL